MHRVSPRTWTFEVSQTTSTVQKISTNLKPRKAGLDKNFKLWLIVCRILEKMKEEKPSWTKTGHPRTEEKSGTGATA
jgi:hypothetical protein